MERPAWSSHFYVYDGNPPVGWVHPLGVRGYGAPRPRRGGEIVAADVGGIMILLLPWDAGAMTNRDGADKEIDPPFKIEATAEPAVG